ncbi:unnamed protein product [Adineta steineri]|uniref:Uncharacterized protein n=1 Tax=Adineta steineri TaxID=433720 RepID=A0A815A6T6_9BILA|nr:unnamed protein product [Adineta steineri]
MTESQNNILNSAELYDLATGNWTTIAHMSVTREYHTASVLENGIVVVTGGQTDEGSSAFGYSYDVDIVLNSAELY